MCEVIFLKVIVFVKREFRCADLRYLLIGMLVNLGLGILSHLIGGRPQIYRLLLLPRFSPPAAVFVIVWTIVYLLLGAAFGLMYASCRGKNGRLRAILLYALLLLWLFLWYPIFFGAGLFLFALIIAGLILVTSCFVFRAFIKRSLAAAAAMIPCILWFAFAFVLNFCVLLLNG